MTLQFIPFLILAAALIFGVYKLAQYLSKRDAAYHASIIENKGPVSDHGQHPDPAAPVEGSGSAPASNVHEVSK